ncbi:MAG: hypothetical protein EA398_03420 [Deltaproteobacteria bacterium]|nr:MAG: hypothetical protein EA398_03420 [Deltaproteobacteria bacterium]
MTSWLQRHVAGMGRFGHRLAVRLDTPMRRQRGTALVIVLATVAILTVSIVEFVYQTRVNLHLAANQRDEVKAYFLARSGVNLQLLALNYQHELSNAPMIGPMVERSNFQLWEYLDLLLPTYAAARLESPIGSLDLEDTGATGFGGLTGDISFSRPMPEEGKINVNSFAGRNIDQATLQALCNLIRPPAYDDVFASSIARQRALRDRFDLVGAIIDHIDSDSDLTVVDENCNVSMGGRGNESSRYVGLEWGPKNEPLVSLDELALVPGVSDGFLEQFRDNLTVYPVPLRFYPNLSNAQAFLGFLCSHVTGGSEDVNPCSLPVIAQQVYVLALALEGYVNFFSDKMRLIAQYTGFMDGISDDRVLDVSRGGQMIAFQQPRDFVNVLNVFRTQSDVAMQFMLFSDPGRRLLFGMGGVGGSAFIPPDIAVTFNDRAMLQQIEVGPPRVFTIEATGHYGVASRTIRAVVDLGNDSRLLYWREF